MKHDQGVLRAYLDGELAAADANEVVQHLAECGRCRAELEALRARSETARLHLTRLPPPTGEPDARGALALFRRSTQSPAASRGWGQAFRRSFDMTKKNLMSGAWRPLAIALTAVLALVVLFSIAPVREAAADILGLFRVRKFAVIPIDPAQAERLEGLAQQAENVLGEPTVLREPGPEQAVSDAAQASAVAGFNVRLPGELPQGAVQTSFTVQTGPAVRFEAERAVIESLMQAAGVPANGLPQTEKIAATVDVGPGAVVTYQIGSSWLRLTQTPSPAIDVPEGLDVVALSEVGFQLLGIPPEDARRLATTIDWSSTLVIPLPTDMARAQEVTVDGTAGLLIKGRGAGRNGQINDDSLLLWERDGIVYAVTSSNLESLTLLSVADSLQ